MARRITLPKHKAKDIARRKAGPTVIDDGFSKPNSSIRTVVTDGDVYTRQELEQQSTATLRGILSEWDSLDGFIDTIPNSRVPIERYRTSMIEHILKVQDAEL